MANRKPRWLVYILRCADGTLYTGITTDVVRRLTQHNAGTASKYTRARRPVELAYSEKASGHGPALQREVAIKKLPRAVKDVLIAKSRLKPTSGKRVGVRDAPPR